MPDIDTLMQEWPSQLEEVLKEFGIPTADFDCDVATYQLSFVHYWIFQLVMGPGLGPARARPRPFLEGPSPVLTEGPKPGPARARRQKPEGLEGLL